MRIAVYPGSFDPITLGHLNIVKRASRLFDKLYVCIAVNSAKKPNFSIDERVNFVRRVTKKFENVEVDSFDGLLVDYAASKEAKFIVKGLRALSDFDMEFQMALVNKKLGPSIETVFLTAEEKYTYLSSTIAREMAMYNADLSNALPREIIDDVLAKLKK
ncbi:MAG: pantetheine-phosphate adenylyltransferase [Oscillospiraceae bacterium]